MLIKKLLQLIIISKIGNNNLIYNKHKLSLPIDYKEVMLSLPPPFNGYKESRKG